MVTDPIIKGPRPLSLHFSNSQIIWTAAGESGSAALAKGLWHPSLKAQVDALSTKVREAAAHENIDAAIQARAADRKDTFLAGINRYLSHTYYPPACEAEVCHRIGGVQLLDYGGAGEPILLVPSLINPHYILDLMPGRSLVAYLQEKGYRPFLINWGDLNPQEAAFGLDDYITKRLIPMLAHVVAMAGSAVPVVGYCMGGTLTIALAARTNGLISKLVLLAAPWDFGTERPHAGRKYVPQMLKHIEGLPEGGFVAVDMMQTFFASVDPTLNDRKFRSYAAGKYEGEQADFFAAMEVWANNGAPLARKVAEETMRGWYRDNDTMLGRWVVDGAPVRPADIDCPVWVAAPASDRLVPQESAFAVLEEIKVGTRHAPPSGHIGMVVGDRAKAGLWEPMVEWLEADHAA